MVSKREKTLILTIASQHCEKLFIEWLVSLRTLGNYHGEVMVLDYGIGHRERVLATKLGAKLYRCKMPMIERTIVDYRFVDMLPIIEQHYRQYKIAHFDADIWFTSEIDELFNELDDIPGCLYSIECRTKLPNGGRGPQDPQTLKWNADKIDQVIRHCKGHINGGFVAARYQPFVDKLIAMRDAFANGWGIYRVNQYLINVLFDFDRDRANGNRWNCSIGEAIKKGGEFFHIKNSDMLLRNGRWILDRIHVEKVVGLHLNSGKKKTERFSKFHSRLFRHTISSLENGQIKLEV
jgi:hypothetical protein